MKGKVGSNVEIDADFVRNDTLLEGNYSYRLYVDDSLTHLSPIIVLYGDIDRHNHAVLLQMPDNDTAITGLFSDHRFTGSWYGPDTAELPFSLNETYPEGSLPMKVFYLHDDKELNSDSKYAPTAEVEFTLLYPEPASGVPENVKDSVVKFIQLQVFGQYRPEVLPKKLLAQSEQDFYHQFFTLNSHWKTNHAQGFNMERKETVSVLFNSNYLLCLQYQKKGYAGRGNPMEHDAYDMIDLRSGEKLNVRNIFKQNALPHIARLVNKTIKENNGLPPSASLKALGYYTDSVPLSNNMAFTGNGITFIYNVYNIAPPAMGIQKVFLPFAKIWPFIRPSSVLYRLSP